MSNERYELNKNLAQMLKGGVIMDVTTPEQAKIAEAAGACAVMALPLLLELSEQHHIPDASICHRSFLRSPLTTCIQAVCHLETFCPWCQHHDHYQSVFS